MHPGLLCWQAPLAPRGTRRRPAGRQTRDAPATEWARGLRAGCRAAREWKAGGAVEENPGTEPRFRARPAPRARSCTDMATAPRSTGQDAGPQCPDPRPRGRPGRAARGHRAGCLRQPAAPGPACRAPGCTAATRRAAPPSWPTGRSAAAAAATPCWLPAAPRRAAQRQPPLLDVLRLGSSRTAARPGSARTRRSPRRSRCAPAGHRLGPGPRDWPTPCSAGSPPGTSDSWIAAVAPDRAADPVGYLASRPAAGLIIAAVGGFAGRGAGHRAAPDRGGPRREPDTPPGHPVRRPGAGHPRRSPRPGRPAEPRGGRRSAPIWTAVTRPGYLRSGRAVWPCRTRRASSLRSALARAETGTAHPATPARARRSAGAGDRRWLDLCAGPGGRRGCLQPGSRRAATPGCSPPTSGNTGRGWCARRRADRRRRRGRGGRHPARLAERLVRPGNHRRPLLRARGPAAAAGRPVAQDARRRGGARRRCSAPCSAPRSPPPGPAG